VTNTFSEFLMNCNRGGLDEQLNAVLREVVLAVKESQKPGSVTLKLKVTPNDDRTVEVEPSVSHTAPKPSLGKGIFFPGEDGELLTRDPDQPALPFRELQSRVAEVRTLNTRD
jgi:hypothetical protein